MELWRVPAISLRNMKPLTEAEKEANRISSQQLLDQYKKAHDNLVKYCEEKGIEVFHLRCQGK